MWKMILGQAIYQLAVTFMLYFAGDKILGAHLDDTDLDHRSKQLSTVVFNTFVWMQIFNEFNNRRLDNKFNIFEGMLRNYWFLSINAVMVGGQVMIVYVGGQAFGVTRLSGILWAVCIICALGCLPWAVVLRTIPDRHFGVVFNAVVGGMNAVLRPVVKGFNALARGLKALFQPLVRFTRRLFSRRENKTGDSDESSIEIPSTTQTVDEEAPASTLTPAPPKVIREDDPERPRTPPAIAVPPILVTSSP
jgi:Ca2+-transporting ATPase